jgi:hypothetical protein
MLRLRKVGIQEGRRFSRYLEAPKAPQNEINPEGGKNPLALRLVAPLEGEGCSSMRPSGSILDLLIILRVQLSEVLQVFRELVQHVNRRGFANRNARATVNALDWAYKKLFCFSELGFVLARMNAVHRTNLHALLIFRANVCYYISHNTRLLRLIEIGGPEPRSQ